MFRGNLSKVYNIGAIHMTSAKFSDFWTPPLVRKFTQPPLLSFITMSAFEGTPLPPLCGHHISMAPYRMFEQNDVLVSGAKSEEMCEGGGKAPLTMLISDVND